METIEGSIGDRFASLATFAFVFVQYGPQVHTYIEYIIRICRSWGYGHVEGLKSSQEASTPAHGGATILIVLLADSDSDICHQASRYRWFKHEADWIPRTTFAPVCAPTDFTVFLVVRKARGATTNEWDGHIHWRKLGISSHESIVIIITVAYIISILTTTVDV